VLREGVRLVQEREAAWAKFEVEIMKGVDAALAGDTFAAEDVRAELLARYETVSRDRAV
jgi:antitoxin ParD1/3/4